MQNYFDFALHSNVGDLTAMKLTCMTSIYHVCGQHDNCPKSVDTWCQYQKEKQDNTNQYKSKSDLLIHIRRAILPIYQSHRKSVTLVKSLMAKPKTLANHLTGWFGTVCPKQPKSDYTCYLLVSMMPFPTFIMVKNLPKIL